MTVYYICPSCGHSVTSQSRNHPRTAHPKLRVIERAIRLGRSNSEIAKLFKLSRGQIAGIRFRYWNKVRASARNRR